MDNTLKEQKSQWYDPCVAYNGIFQYYVMLVCGDHAYPVNILSFVRGVYTNFQKSRQNVCDLLGMR